MIAIVNVSSEDAPNLGPNQYEVRINKTVIATFTHNRKANGISQCLRDAADEVDRQQEQKKLYISEKILAEIVKSADTFNKKHGL